MDCAENDFNDTRAESIDSCAVSSGFDVDMEFAGEAFFSK